MPTGGNQKHSKSSGVGSAGAPPIEENGACDAHGNDEQQDSLAGCERGEGELEEQMANVHIGNGSNVDDSQQHPAHGQRAQATEGEERGFKKEERGRRACDWNVPVRQGAGQLQVLKQYPGYWAEDHPEQLLPWKFPSTRRDCIKVTYRQLDKLATLAPASYLNAMITALTGFPPSVARVASYLTLNYLRPHHKRIAQQGRHLLMLTVYETRQEAHCWFMPLDQVVERHATSSESIRSGVSYNDVQLVQTYDVQTVFALHAEVFEQTSRSGGSSGRSSYGLCTWIGGMALHAAADTEEAFARSQEFAHVPDEQMEMLAERNAREREKRQRKKARQKAAKAEAAAAREHELQAQKEAEEAAQQAKRKEGLIPVHESLVEALAKGTLRSR